MFALPLDFYLWILMDTRYEYLARWTVGLSQNSCYCIHLTTALRVGVFPFAVFCSSHSAGCHTNTETRDSPYPKNLILVTRYNL